METGRPGGVSPGQRQRSALPAATEGTRRPKVTQIVLNLQGKPGVLGNVSGAPGREGINVEGICVAETAGHGKI